MTPETHPNWHQIGDGLNEVWTDGDRVRRPARPWSDAIHQLLRHLETRDLDGVPRPIAIDDDWEVLTYVPGTVAMRPWPPPLQSTEWLTDLGRWLRAFHTATRDFELEEPTRFAWGPVESTAEHVVTHGDLGPWNTVIADGELAGVIDWEFARFGDPLDDLAEAAFEFGPLRENHDMLHGEVTTERIRERVEALCRGYGDAAPDAVLAHVEPMYRDRITEAKTLAAADHEPFVSSADAGALDALAADLAYFRDHWKPHLR